MKKKIIYCIICALITAAFALNLVGCNSQDDNNVEKSDMEEFVENFDRHSPFVDNQVLVILTEEVSFENIFHDYTVEDFTGIGAIDVEELDGATSDSTGVTYKIRQYLSEDSSGNTIPEHLKHYNRIFAITLDKKDEDNVLRAVYVLRQRPEIYLAEPNWLEAVDV